MFVTFGVGDVYINPIAGNEATQPMPVQLLGLQDISIEISQTLKELKGANKGPDDVATAEMKLTGKAQIGRVDIDLFNQAFFADTTTPNLNILISADEAGTVPGVSTYIITVSHSSVFSKDLGVRYASNMQPLQRVASGPTQGQYSVSSGVYTFSSADASTAMLLSYVYTSTAGKTLTVHNQLMGYGPVCEMYLWEPYSSTLNTSTANGWHLYAVRFSKLSNMLKRDDFDYPQLEFEAYPNAAGQWFDIIDGSGF